MGGPQFGSKIIADSTCMSIRQSTDDVEFSNVIDLSESIRLSPTDQEDSIQDLYLKMQAQNKLIKTLKISNELLEKTNRVLRRKNINLEHSTNHQDTGLDLLIKELSQRIDIYTEQIKILTKTSKGIKQLEQLLASKENVIRSLQQSNQQLIFASEMLNNKCNAYEDSMEKQGLELKEIQSRCLESQKIIQALKEKLQILSKQQLPQEQTGQKGAAELQSAQSIPSRQLNSMVFEQILQLPDSQLNIKIADNHLNPQSPPIQQTMAQTVEEQKVIIESRAQESFYPAEQMRHQRDQVSEEQLGDQKQSYAKGLEEWQKQRSRLEQEKVQAYKKVAKLRIAVSLSIIFTLCSWAFRMP